MRKIIIITLFLLCTGSTFSQRNKNAESAAKPFVLGSIEEIQSKELGEKRTLNIYLPDTYNPKDTISYPVIYVLDGSANEDFIHISGLVQFNSFESVRRVPKSIVVGIANVDRRRDFTFSTTIEEDKKRFPTTGQSGKFISFIEKELQPFIDNKYRTNSSKTIIGQSLGGLLATEILISNPELFNTYIIVSPSLWWNNGSLLNIAAKPALQKTTVYIAVGKEGLTPTAIPRVMEVDANLLVDKLRKERAEIKALFDYLPDEDHGTILHQAVMNAFKQISSREKN